MTTKKLKIHTENILPIIKQWLYSEKDIFLRELVSNACDALNKLKVLRDLGEADFKDEELRIDIKLDADAKTLSIIDTGIGMDAAEVEKYIGEVAFSGAEDFLKKYETQNEQDQIIGHFGLGFFSSYMVASQVEIDTLSCKKGASPASWSSDGSAEYTVGEGSRKARGTEVKLHLSDAEYLDAARLRQILNHYCAFLPFPIYLNGDQTNKQPPLWTKPVSECRDEEYLAFYRHLYPMEEEPLFWVHLNVDYPFHLKAILYFPKIRPNLEFSKNTIKLFCNRVFVSDNCKDLIPEYLTVLRGAIDSPDIPLNVSRSFLQMDKTVRQLSSHIGKKVSDKLVSLYRTDAERYHKCWRDLEVIIKLGAMQDEKFYERVQEAIIWKNIQGEWTTLKDYLERNQEKHEGRVFYTGDEKHAPSFLNLYREKGVEVLYTNGYIDTHMIGFLEGKNEGVRFARVDGSVDDVIVDNEKEAILPDWIKESLEVEVEAKSLASDSLPGFVLFDEQARRMREYLAMSGSKDLPLSGPKTFVINTNSKLIDAIQRLHQKDAELAGDMLRQLYDQALLSQNEMQPGELDAFLNRSNAVWERLISRG